MAESLQKKGRNYIVFRDIETMNTRDARQGLNPKHASWLENLQPIGANELTTVPGLASALATIAGTITRMFFACFTAAGGVVATNVVDWAVVFNTLGAGYVIQLSNAAVTQFAANGTFSNFPDVTQWKSERILIADTKAGYATYDNSTFVVAGGVSPNIVITNGGAYGSAPSVTISGGSGSGATAVAHLTSGTITKIILTNPGSGYQPGDTLTVSFGSGAATATAIVWPFLGFGTGGGAYTINLGVTNGGHYYTSAPTVTISGGSGTGATAVAIVSGGAVIGLSVTNSGSGYVNGDVLTVTIAAPPASVQATATSSAGGPFGNVTAVTITNPGYGYTSTPAIHIAAPTGGATPIQATAVANMSASTVASASITNPGQGYVVAHPGVTIDAPPAAVTATAVGSVSGGSPANVGSVSTLAVFQGRVWLGNLRTLIYTGTAGYDDTNPANAAGSTTITDADLAHKITALRSLNNYLYIFGDNALKQIGSISVSGSATLFSILTLSSDQGTTFPMTIQSHDRFVVFANTVGVFATYGATVQKISDMMDGIFQSINFANDLQAATGDINNIRAYLLLVNAIDYAGVRRSLFLTFFNKRWFIVSGANNEIAIATMNVSPERQVFKSSGTDLTQMFYSDVTAVNFVHQTALTDHGRMEQGKRALRIGVMQESGVAATLTLTSDSEQGSVAQTYAQPPTFFWEEGQAAASGLLLGATLTGSAYDYTCNAIVVEYEDTALMKSSNLTN